MKSAFEIIRCKDEAEWLALRNTGIGASDVAIVLGLSDWGSPFHLWALKTGSIQRAEYDQQELDILEYGRYMEAPTAKRYADRTGRKLIDFGRYTVLRSRQLALSSRDARPQDRATRGGLHPRDLPAPAVDAWPGQL
jgi:predicted phage-related endonuclease